MFTSGANMADYVLMLTRTNPDSTKHRGLTMFIVPLKAEGVEIQPVFTFQGERTNITYYDGVRIPDSYRLGEINGGARVMAASLEMEHGASWAKTQWHMLHEAETFCRETSRGGAAMIDRRQGPHPPGPGHCAHADHRDARLALAVGERREASRNQGQGSMGKLFSSEAFRVDSADLLDLARPNR